MAAVPCRDMLKFRIAAIRPVTEYPAPVWHTGLTAELGESLESVQKRALRIISGSNSFLLVFLLGCLCNIEVTLKFRLKCLILGVYTCFYQVGNRNWHKEGPFKCSKKKNSFTNYIHLSFCESLAIYSLIRPISKFLS